MKAERVDIETDQALERCDLCCNARLQLLRWMERCIDVEADPVSQASNDGHDVPSVFVEEVEGGSRRRSEFVRHVDNSK